MQRVAIVGLFGAGKTTLAAKLGKLTGLDVHQTDRMFLQADGSAMSSADRRAKLDLVLSAPAYIVEGAHGWTFGPRIARSDTVIWLDLGVIQRALNTFRRRRKAYRTGQAIGRPLLGRARFWGWFFLSYDAECKALLAALAARPEGARLVHLRSFAEVQAFLDSLPK